MAGGTWKIQNKVRPGAYLNFIPVIEPEITFADRGIATMPLVMDWGPEKQVVEVLSFDLADGKSLTKIGYTAADVESLLFRLCLQNCYKLLAYRVNSGGDKATVTLGNLTATAKYSGVRGNDISVAVIENDTDFDVVTYVDGVEQDRQTVDDITGLIANDWVIFSGSGDLTATVATALTNGTNGTVGADAYTDYFEAMKTQSWQVMGIPSSDSTLPPLLKVYILDLRENKGRKVQGACYDYAADYEGIITSKQGYKTANETVSVVDFVAWVTGASAGAKANESNTYKLIEGATEIINPLTDDEIEAALQEGWYVISKRTDGKIIIEQDINTLTTVTSGEKDKAFRKNRVIRTLDDIGTKIANIFETGYIGKVNNTAAGRDLFKADIVKYCYALQAESAIQNFDAQNDITIQQGNDIDSVLVGLNIQPVDSMEKLYMTVEVG
jgi:hypothetical protein